MRIQCPFCGERDSSEFIYLGDANRPRPDVKGHDGQARSFETFYLRDNPSGSHNEIWYHASGCRSCLCVTRDTSTHEIFAVDFMKGAAGL